ncbi:MAG: class I SAM-dependent methyltransferase [Archangium sp.]
MTSFAHDSAELAEAYERTSDLQFESGKRLVERLRLEPSTRVLDVGCGTGRLTRWIAQLVAHVVGIDPLAQRIEFARTLASPARFEVGRAEELGAFADESFDAVCLSSVLHWVSDKPRALAEAHRVLRPGGRLAITTLPQELSSAGTISQVLQPLLRRHADRIDRSALTRSLTTTELITLLGAAGFELDTLEIAPTTHEHESAEAFVEFAEASSFGNLLALAPGLRAELIGAFPASGPVTIRGWTTTLIATRPSRSRAASSAA